MSLLYWLPMLGTLENQGLSAALPVNHGATVGTSGKLGKCYDFSGTALYIDTGFKESFGTGDFSISVWFKLTDSGSRTYLPIISNKTTGAASVGCAIYYNHSQQKFLWSTADGSGATEVWMAQTYSYSGMLNTWHHIVMVRNSSDAKKGYFYIDGVRYELASVPAIRNVTNTTYNLLIGDIGSHNNANYLWTGSLCDLRIYDTALSPREIKEISKGLVLHYPLNREGFGADNLLSRYVSPGQQNPGATADWGRTKYYGDYGIIIPATENADTYFRLFLRKLLTSNSTYTISCHVSGLVDGTFYAFPLFALGNVAMGLLLLNHNGLNSMTFTMTYGTQTAVTVGSETVYICFMDDANRSIATGLGPITVTHFKIEEGSTATPFVPAPTDALYTKMGLDENVVYDTSGYKYNGTVVDGGISYSSDTVRYNVSAEFDGVNSAIAIPWSTFYKLGDVFTLNLWWKKSSLGSKNYETLFGGSGIEMDTRAGGASTLSLYMASTRGGNLYTPFSFNEWYMNTLVNDGTNELYYVNGQLVKTIEKKNMPTGTCYIGAWTSHTSQNYKGLISDFRIYKTALSADDILELYHTPITLSNNGTLMTQGEYVEV